MDVLQKLQVEYLEMQRFSWLLLLTLVGKAQTNFTLTAPTNQLLHWNFNRNKILKAQMTKFHSLLQIFLIKGGLHGHNDYTTQNTKCTVLNSKND